ncbi:MAG: acyl-ACP--UDP-N-acetylglucosamine O-acyltransferase [Planctomycetota bacterium]|jgi:UDP-N-acetylglucosamine acyltransferase
MAQVHASTVIEGEVDLAPDVEIGPGCVLTGPMRIGAGTRLLGHVHLQGPLTLGERNLIYPFACLGFAPQSVTYEPTHPGEGLEIGDENVFREGVTISRAMTDEGPTRLGDHNYFMANSHVGHDGQVANRCIFANCVALGGHVHVGDGAVLGGNTVVHQFCQIGRGAMLTGGAAASRDLPPFFMLTGINIAGSVNLVGLRRSGMSAEEIKAVRWVYGVLYRQGLTLAAAQAALAARADEPIVSEYLEFIDRSTRGICSGHFKPARSLAGHPEPAAAETASGAT